MTKNRRRPRAVVRQPFFFARISHTKVHMQRHLIPRFDRCAFDAVPLQRRWPSFLVNYYADTDAYDAFRGDDLTPHSHHLYAAYTKYSTSLRTVDGGVGYAFCSVDADSDSRWHVQRIGPFLSKGGYDWWQMAAHDVLNMSAASLPACLLESALGVVDLHGTPLSYPPFHIHHIHISPEQESLRYHDPKNFSIQYVLERHGEWGHRVPSTEAEPDGFCRKIDFPLVLDMEINDARPAGSAPLTWYLQLAVRWRPFVQGDRSVSVMNIRNPNHNFPGAPPTPSHTTYSDAHQLSQEAYFWVPTANPFVSWYTGHIQMPGFRHGTLRYIKGHNHENLLVKSLMFAAPLDALQLGEAFTKASTAFHVHQLSLNASGYGTFDSLERHLRLRAQDALVCVVVPTYEVQHGVHYDRPPDSACRPWSFRQGDPVTFVTFLEYRHALEPWLTHRPSMLPMHTHWLFAYEDSGDVSCYGGVSMTSDGRSVGDRTCTATEGRAKGGVRMVSTTSATVVVLALVAMLGIGRFLNARASTTVCMN